MKITKNREYRLNFVEDGKHYSINEFDDGYEKAVGVYCKEDDKYATLGWSDFYSVIGEVKYWDYQWKKDLYKKVRKELDKIID